jgi:hypothetical protein
MGSKKKIFVGGVSVGGGELIVDGGRLVFQIETTGHTGELRSWNLLPAGKLWELRPDGLLELHRGVCGDGQNFGEPELADDLSDGIKGVQAAAFGRKHGASSLSVVLSDFLHYIQTCRKWQERSRLAECKFSRNDCSQNVHKYWVFQCYTESKRKWFYKKEIHIKAIFSCRY